MARSTAERINPCWAAVAEPLGLPAGGDEPAGVCEPTPTQEAWAGVPAWLGCETVRIPQPMNRHPELFGRLLSLPGVRANLVHDAHLAAMAIEHGLILCSTDGDFARFPGLRSQNPLAA